VRRPKALKGRLHTACLVTLALGLLALAVVLSRAAVAVPAGCPDTQFSAGRSPSNPLALPRAPGPNPLRGARFFVDGPKRGPAAGAIARLLGMDPTTFPDGLSWREFRQRLATGAIAARLAGDPVLARQVRLLEKIADQPEAMRFSSFSGGGGPGAVLGQVHKILCHNLTADPGTIPIITTYFVHPDTTDTAKIRPKPAIAV
jgi:hypothetical protein